MLLASHRGSPKKREREKVRGKKRGLFLRDDPLGIPEVGKSSSMSRGAGKNGPRWALPEGGWEVLRSLGAVIATSPPTFGGGGRLVLSEGKNHQT